MKKRFFWVLVIFTILMNIALFLAVPFGRMRQNARLQQSESNLQLLACAMMNYRDLYGSWPPARTVDKNGKPLHSWRTLLLPFLGEADLYKKIDLNEPWDSQTNLPFHAIDLAPFRSPAEDPLFHGACFWSVVMGEDTLFPFSGSVSEKDLPKGSASVILIVERPDPVHWMDPNRELTWDQIERSVDFPIGKPNQPVALVLFTDGSIRKISSRIDRDLLLKLLRRE